MRKTNAIYDHQVLESSGRNFIIIRDQCKKEIATSVTNAIDQIVEEICLEEMIDPDEHFVIYRDSEGTWDGYNPTSRKFMLLNAVTMEAAINVYISKQNGSVRAL